MKIETVSIDSLSLDPANARLHSPRNLEAIKSSLRRFGQQKPIVVGANNVVRAGNGTLQAAKALGWKEIKIVRTKLVDSEASAFAIADNRTAELAEWDEDPPPRDAGARFARFAIGCAIRSPLSQHLGLDGFLQDKIPGQRERSARAVKLH